MNFATLSLALLIVGLCPKMVRGQLFPSISLFEASPSSSVFDLADFPSDISTMMRRHDDLFSNAMASLRGSYSPFPMWSSPTSPRYEVLNNKDKFQLVVDNLGGDQKPSDMDVKFDERTRLLTVSGQQKIDNEDTGYHFSSQFSRSFTLDPFVEVDEMAATMDHGVLTITAPKNADKMEHYAPVRSIPVTSLLDEIDQEPRMELPSPETTTGEKVQSVSHSTDPFHVKERIEKARQDAHLPGDATTKANPNDVLVNPGAGYKTSELRRRR